MSILSVADSLSTELIHQILSFLTSPADLATASLLNKHWYAADCNHRRSIKVNNCFAVSPSRLFRRFQSLNSLTLVARPDVLTDITADIKWRVYADPWIECLSKCCSGLRELKLKRFVISYRSISLIATSFPDLRSLVFVGCVKMPGFGISSILSGCRFLQVLELRDFSCMNKYEQWLIDFPVDCVSLVSLSFVNVKARLDLAQLEQLILRCPNLKCLKFDEPLQRDALIRFLKAAPNLVELGFGSSLSIIPGESRNNFADAIMKLTSVQSLSGAWHPNIFCMMNPLFSKLLFLDMTKIRVYNGVIQIQHCHNLQRLWVLNSVGDNVLQEVGNTCKKLHELKVISSVACHSYFPFGREAGMVTDVGLAAIALGCSTLQSVTYSCMRMSNAALVTLARRNPGIRRFELTLLTPEARDVHTSSSFNDGIAAIFNNCRDLVQFSIRNAYVTDQVFFFAGMCGSGSQLRKLSVEFAGDSNVGIFHTLYLCRNLKQLVIKGHFDDVALLAAAEKFKNQQFVWINSRGVTVKGSKTLTEKLSTDSTLSVDIMDPIGKAKGLPLHMEVQNLLIYRNLREPNLDEP